MRTILSKIVVMALALIMLVGPIANRTIFADVTPSYTYYPIPTAYASPGNIAQGPDGAMWFTETATDKIGRVTSDGTITEYPTGTTSGGVQAITPGPDGAMWFTEVQANEIGRISMSGSVTLFSLPTASALPYAITTGPDGALWFTEYNLYKIGRITTDGQISEYPANGIPFWIATNPTSGLWSTDNVQSMLRHYLTDGSNDIGYNLTQYSTPSKIAPGPDGTMWFAEAYSSGNPAAGNKIGKLTADGSISEYAMPYPDGFPSSVTSGPDNAVWTAWNSSVSANRIFKVSSDGTFTDYTAGQSFGYLTSIAGGSDGNLWLTDRDHNAIIKMNPNAAVVTPDAANLAINPTAGVTNVGASATFTVNATSKLGAPITNAIVRFIISGSDNLTGSCLTASDGTCIFSYDGPNLPGADNIKAYVDTNKNQILDLNEPVAVATQAWTLPQLTSGQVAGGGHIAAIDGQQNIAFGFTAKSVSGQGTGSCQLIDQSVNINIHCYSVDSMVVSGKQATIFGSATSSQGGAAINYRLDVTDAGEPGTSDTFALYTSTGYSAHGTLTNGNIQVNQ